MAWSWGSCRNVLIASDYPFTHLLQVVQTVERVLYASNDEESKRVIAEAQV
jgi:hypothetical protein